MSVQDRSPKPNLAPLLTTHSTPPSPLVSPSSPSSPSFTFPPSATTPTDARSSSPSVVNLSSTNRPSLSATSSFSSGASSTSRFHEALAAIPSRHQSSESTSSSSSSENAFRFPPDSASPSGATAFDLLQRELSGNSGMVGLGLGDQSNDSGAAAPFEQTPEIDSRFYDEPETLDEFIRAEILKSEGATRTREQTLTFEGVAEAARDTAVKGSGSRNASGGVGSDLNSMGGFGRPASMAMGDVDFLLSPPPLFIPPPSTSPVMNDVSSFPPAFEQPTRTYSPASSFGFPPAGTAVKKDRGRTFPAPLLLKGDRPFGGTASPILGSVAPLTVRKSSVSTGSTFPSSQTGPLPITTRPPWTPLASSSAAPPTRSVAPYEHHRPQQSSLSQSQSQPQSQNQSQSSIIYNHSHTTSVSSAANSSPGIGGSSGSHSTSSSLAQPSTSQTSPGDAPITPQALLLLIHSLRSTSHPMGLSQSQGPPSRSGTPLFSQPANHQRIRSAGSSTSDNEDGGSPTRTAGAGKMDTVDLSHQRVAEVPIEVIDELRDEVEKFALGYNLLKDLPTQFSALTRLRYLNVRVNLLTVFPQVLCEMPGLEILDISRNKIRRLPTIPGTLLNLKVFSIAKNRVKRLPTYLVQMSHLKVFKVDHNPLEWPPKDITTFPISGSFGASIPTPSNGTSDGEPRKNSGSKVEEAEEMHKWLSTLTKWIRENGDRRPGVRTSLPPVEQPFSDEERDRVPPEDRVMDALLSRSNGARTDSSRIVPLGSTPSVRPRPSVGPSRPPPEEESAGRNHSRNASHSTVQSLEPELRPGLRPKKSLPDLRQPHADILAERRTGANNAEAKLPLAAATVRRLKHPGIQHSSSARAILPSQQTLASSSGAVASSPTPLVASATPRQASKSPQITATASLSKSVSVPRRPNTPNSAPRADFDQANPKRSDMDRAPTGGFDRNSGAYFRRLSMLPPSTISKAVPVTLLEFADAIRGILFSLSQVYTALRQFVVFASQDRLPAPLARLMGTADGSMSLLINALDRFDSLSRRGTPEASIVRDIFVTCRDNVVTFHKLVTALGPELKSLISTADVRYTRTLLLMLYGSTGEIAKSWNAVTPLLAEMSEMNEDTSLATLILHPPTPSPTLPGSSRSGSTGIQRTRSKTRRHAGSFSVEDVQLGAVLPPASVPALPTPPAAYSSEVLTSLTVLEDGSYDGGGTIKARPSKLSRQVPPTITLPPYLGQRGFIVNALEQPLTPGFQPESGGDSFHGGSHSTSRSDSRLHGNTYSGTSSADETFLSMVEATTGIAFDVYGMLINSFDEAADGRDGEGAAALMHELGTRRTKELMDLCILGNEVTTKLTGSLGRVRGPDRNQRPSDFSASDAKRLGDDAYTFVQTVIRFAKLVKAISLEHGFAPRVREGVGQLTISTREFAKALTTNTSFRPLAPTATASSNLPHRGFNHS